jgi:hypothetical protein
LGGWKKVCGYVEGPEGQHEFIAMRSDQRYCGKSCKKRAKRARARARAS